MIWLVLLATTATQALTSLAALAMPAIAPELARFFGIDAAMIGYQLSLVYAGATFSSLYGGLFVRRWGAARTSQTALGLCGIGMLTATLPSLVTAAIGSGLIGIAYGLTNPAASHLLARFSQPGNRNLIFSLKQTGVPIGGTLAGLILPPVALAYGWSWALAGVGVALLALAVALEGAHRVWDDDRDPTIRLRQNPLSGIGVVWRIAPVRWLSLMAFMFSAVQLCLTGFVVTMLVGEMRVSLIEAGVILSFIQVMGVVARILWGWLADRIRNGRLVLLILGVVMLAAIALTMSLAPAWPRPLMAAVLVLFGATAIGWNGVFMAEVARPLALDQVSRVTGGALFFTFMGVIVGPPMFTAVYGLLGRYTSAFGLAFLFALAGVVMVALALRSTRPSAPRP
ncbi:MAG: MFS transporter [Rhodospirillales bacterium]|nr:MFS transporter [Rhodospirillales bacterium]